MNIGLPQAPYRGIAPFRFIDQQIFAAREEEIWTLLSNITLYRAVLFYGDSGVGKSSLINAGLFPQALKENYLIAQLRVQPFNNREIKVQRIPLSEGKSEGFLESSFQPTGDEVEADAASFELSVASFREQLEQFRSVAPETESSGPESAKLFREHTGGARPLLVFDQFEEFITLFEEAQRTGDGSAARRAQGEILQTLVELIQDETLPVKIIFVFREDYLAKLSLLFDHCPELLDQSQRLLPPPVKSLPRIIRAPFFDQQLRAHFLEPEGVLDQIGSELPQALAQRIADDLGTRAGPEAVNLTELQIVCLRLWHSPRPEKQYEDDGIPGLLKSYGTDVFLGYTLEERDAAVALLSYMVTAANTRNIVEEGELLSRAAETQRSSQEQLGHALAKLIESQIVRREVRRDIYFYEITSEYLVPWIRERVAERNATEKSRKIEAEHDEALERLRNERRRSRALRSLAVGLLLLLIACAVAWLKSYQSSRRAVAAEAETAKVRSQLSTFLDALTALNNPNEDEALKGVQKIEGLIKTNSIPSESKNVLAQLLLSSPNESVRKAGFGVVFEASKNDPKLKESLVHAIVANEELGQGLSPKETNQLKALSPTLPPRFYIQITAEEQRNIEAQKVTAVLKKNGYIVPGIEKVKGLVSENQLKYFSRDAEKITPSPEDFAALLNNAGVGRWKPIYIKGYENSTKIRPGHFELYLASPTGPDPKVEFTTLVLEFVDEEGHEVGNVHVEITPLDGGSGKSSPNSSTVLLAPGSYQVDVHAEGYEDIKFVQLTGAFPTIVKKLKLRKEEN